VDSIISTFGSPARQKLTQKHLVHFSKALDHSENINYINNFVLSRKNEIKECFHFLFSTVIRIVKGLRVVTYSCTCLSVCNLVFCSKTYFIR
jgi:hypothetical protein